MTTLTQAWYSIEAEEFSVEARSGSEFLYSTPVCLLDNGSVVFSSDAVAPGQSPTQKWNDVVQLGKVAQELSDYKGDLTEAGEAYCKEHGIEATHTALVSLAKKNMETLGHRTHLSLTPA